MVQSDDSFSINEDLFTSDKPSLAVSKGQSIPEDYVRSTNTLGTIILVGDFGR